MEEEKNIIQNEINDVNIEEEGSKVESTEEVEIVEVSASEPLQIDSQDAFPALGADNPDLNHSLLYGRDRSNQHPIIAIEGLREELDSIESLKTVYSDKKQQANYYAWQDENPLQENRDGFFVCLCLGVDKIQKCDDKTDVFGVTVVDAGFVGGQEYIKATDGKKTGRDGTYGLVATTGIIGVRCESNVGVGDYVVPNKDGIAKKSDGDYGYLVTAIEDRNGIDYAIISLAVSSTLAKSLANGVKSLDGRMESAEYNIVSTANIANSAYALAKEAKNNTEIDIGIIEDKINEVLEKVDESSDIVGNISNVVSNASKTAAQAKAIAESAVNSAERIRGEAVATATDALTNVNNLIDDVKPITTWTDGTNTGASYFIEHIQNDLATKTEVETAETNTQHALAEVSKNAAEIQSLIASIDKYSIGEYSQSYGLTLEQAKSILKQDIVYIPTVDHNESTEIPINGNGIDDISTEKFLRGYAYTWDGTGWYVTQANTVVFKKDYQSNSSGSEVLYWVVDGEQDVVKDDVVYNSGGLYKWENGAWVKAAFIADNSINRAVSSIRQTTNEIAAEVTSTKGDVAALDIRISDNESTVQTLASHMIGEYVTIESWDANGKDTSRIYYAQDTKLYWYYKDGTWNSAEKSYEAGLSGTMATIEQKADKDGASIAQVVEAVGENGEVTISSIAQKINDSESSVSIKADKILMTGTTTFLRPSDVGEDGTTAIDGGRIITGQISAGRIDADNLKVKAENVDGALTIGQLPSDVATISQVTTITNDTISTTNIIAENLKIKSANIDGQLTASQIAVDKLSTLSADMGILDAGIIQSKDYGNPVVWKDESTISNGLLYQLINDDTEYEVAGMGTCTDTDVVIPDMFENKPITSIGDSAFRDCSNLTSVTIPGSVTSIGSSAFNSCTSLTSITIPDGVTSVEWNTFSGCSNLTRIVIPDSVTYIGLVAFSDCDSINSVYYKGTEEEWGNITIKGGNELLISATRYYYSETKPSSTGNYWHYKEDGFRISTDDTMIDSRYFKVSLDGKIKATGGEIGGFTISNNLLSFVSDKGSTIKISTESIKFSSSEEFDSSDTFVMLSPISGLTTSLINGYKKGGIQYSCIKNGNHNVPGVGGGSTIDAFHIQALSGKPMYIGVLSSNDNATYKSSIVMTENDGCSLVGTWTIGGRNPLTEIDDLKTRVSTLETKIKDLTGEE